MRNLGLWLGPLVGLGLARCAASSTAVTDGAVTDGGWTESNSDSSGSGSASSSGATSDSSSPGNSGGGSGSSSSGGAGSSSAASSGATSGQDGGSCVSNSDCPKGRLCGYLQSAGCSATGQCIPSPIGPMCGAIAPGCACDGSMVLLGCNGFPADYVSKPFRHSGICMGPGPIVIRDSGPDA
jgi:hypothetical protein